jgi:hypothetical protein
MISHAAAKMAHRADLSGPCGPSCGGTSRRRWKPIQVPAGGGLMPADLPDPRNS